MFFLIKPLAAGRQFISIHTANYTLGYNGNWRGISDFYHDWRRRLSFVQQHSVSTLSQPRLINYTFCTTRFIVIAKSELQASIGSASCGLCLGGHCLSVLILFLLGMFFCTFLFFSLPFALFSLSTWHAAVSRERTRVCTFGLSVEAEIRIRCAGGRYTLQNLSWSFGTSGDYETMGIGMGTDGNERISKYPYQRL